MTRTPPTLLHRLFAALGCLAASATVQAAAIAVELPAFSGTTLLSFDDVAAGTSLTTQYSPSGIASFAAPVLGTSGSPMVMDFNMFLLPGTVSGGQLVSMGASIEFAGDVDRVGAWLYKGNGQHYLSALDASQNVLLTVAASAASGDSEHFDFVGIQSDSRNIRYVVISNKDLSANPQWDLNGHNTFFDDLMFSPPITASITAVPEPKTWVLMLLSLALIGFVVRGRR